MRFGRSNGSVSERTQVRRLNLPQKRVMIAGTIGVAVFAASAYGASELRTHWHDIAVWGEEVIAKQIDARAQQILVSGVHNTAPAALRSALGLQRGDSLVGYDVAAARRKIEALPWVRSASVVRNLPSTLKVDIYEYKPLARLAMNDGNWVINREGGLITNATEGFEDLPLLQGEGAAPAAAELFNLLAMVPQLMNELTGATYVGERRWDLEIAGRNTIMLPEENRAQALQVLLALLEKRDILKGEGVVVDLRQPDRVILRLPSGQDAYL